MSSRSLKKRYIMHALMAGKVVNSTPISDGCAILVTAQPIDDWISTTGGKVSTKLFDLPTNVQTAIENSAKVDSIRIEISVRADTSQVQITDLAGLGEFVLGEHREDGRHITALATMQEASLNDRLIAVGGNRIYSFMRDQPNAPGYMRATGLVKHIRISSNGNGEWVMEILTDSTERPMFKNMNIKEFLLLQRRFNNLQFGSDFIQCPNWKRVYFMISDLVLMRGNYRFTSRGLTTESIGKILEDESTEVRPFDGSFDRSLPAVVERNRDGETIVHTLESLTIAPYQSVPPEKSFGNVPSAPDVRDRYRQTMEMTEAAQLNGVVENRTLESFKIRPSKALKNVKAYCRKHPTIVDFDRKPIPIKDKHQWMVKGKFSCPAKIDRLVVAHKCEKAQIEKGIAALVKDAGFKGMTVARTEYHPIARPQDLRTLAENLGKAAEKQPNILLVFIDSKTNETGHRFLKLFERLHFIRTQQLTTEVARTLDAQFMTRLNILMKMNVKMGGQNVNVISQTPKLSEWMGQKDTMILSYDVSHPVPPKRMQDKNAKATKPSVVGFSGNYGRFIDGYVGDFAFQHPRVEQVDSNLLKSRFANMLAHFQKNHGKQPKRIVVVRDGVSEGQYEMVLRDEFAALTEGWKLHQQRSKGKLPFPPAAVFIGTKRSGIRLFAKDQRGTIQNVAAGTFVQNGVVRPHLNEWVMVAAKPIKGTAQPVTFQPISDAIGMDNDERQDLMYYLTFLHQVSNGTISLPEPLYQADEWAKRGRNLWQAHVDLVKYPQSQFTAEGLTQNDFDQMNTKLSFIGTRFDGIRLNA
ncbi:hypothetical protein WR25_03128 isoform J [Diploscapter pachys]|nr:hypothetical protein WR25_03128 isoform D [Diploscapter pachys]PAV92324.1 hypothetical protein WR25_03128 isoform E [Diploscapter pachys]PAV92329.1 hypothetical protein WR25_03128 isoform J [Diploscapter pachys]